jgi:hypothetical protein
MILALSALLLLQADDLPSATLDSAIKAISGYHERTTTKPADDDAFLKRLYADLLGGPPTNAELQAFVADVLPKKRAAAIDQLVTDDRFNDFWARRFTRVFFGDPDKLRIDDMPGVETAAVRNFERWLSAEFKKDTPWTDIVYRILNARGGLRPLLQPGRGNHRRIPPGRREALPRDPAVLRQVPRPCLR